jgi:hypothetical protein
MPYSGMWHRVALIRNDILEERIGSFIRVFLQVIDIANVVSNCHSFDADDRGGTSLRDVGSYKSHTAPHPRRRHSS